MVEITAVYEGSLRTSATHGPSGSTVETDAPVDNQGRGERFSPTDLVATALGSCMMTIMGIFAQRHEIDLTGTKVRVEKHMTAEAPRRISRIVAEITVPLPEGHPQKRALEKAAVTCPVHLSLHPEIEKDVSFVWAG
ncbi:MAG: OsmC family protein [Verrucomicrobiales bacterium]|nr:OsmC family protein [Verrucomicrobiales bacterium]